MNERQTTKPLRYQEAFDALVEDLEWLLDAGEAPLIVAKRLGYTDPNSLARRLKRWGRGELATDFWRVGWVDRRPRKTDRRFR